MRSGTFPPKELQRPTELQKFPGGSSEIERQKRQGFDEIHIFGVLCAPSIHENQILKALGGNKGNEMGSLKVLEVQKIGKKLLECESYLIDLRKNVNGVSGETWRNHFWVHDMVKQPIQRNPSR